jgi:hypothetical protein
MAVGIPRQGRRGFIAGLHACRDRAVCIRFWMCQVLVILLSGMTESTTHPRVRDRKKKAPVETGATGGVVVGQAPKL